MPESSKVQIQVDQSGIRLDQYLAHAIPHLSRSHIKKLIQQNNVLVDGHPAKPGLIVQSGEVISLNVPIQAANVLVPQTMALKIVYEDETIIVVNKDAGVVVHPAHGHTQDGDWNPMVRPPQHALHIFRSEISRTDRAIKGGKVRPLAECLGATRYRKQHLCSSIHALRG